MEKGARSRHSIRTCNSVAAPTFISLAAKGSVHLKLDEIDEAINCLKQAELLHARLNDLSRSDVELLRHKMAGQIDGAEYARDVWHAVRDKFPKQQQQQQQQWQWLTEQENDSSHAGDGIQGHGGSSAEQIEPEVVITPLPTISQER